MGSIVASRYELLAVLGMGGMGMVYKARDTLLDEAVAIKLIRADVADSPEMGRRFRSEIKLARKVTHLNVCRIHEYGEEGLLRYISMELIEGTDLKQLLRRDGPFEPEEAFELAVRIAGGLGAIHEVGVIHRDLKTSNVMRDRRGVAKLMDFGIAKQWSAEATTDSTGSGLIVGTPDYMSPEQARGEKIDFRSDIYSLGVVILELFTGRNPFHANTPLGTILKHLNDPPPLEGEAAARIPVALVPVLRQALAKHPADRYATAAKMLDALSVARETWAVLESAPTATFVKGEVTPPAATSPAPKRPVALIAVGVLLIGGILAFLARPGRRDVPAEASQSSATSDLPAQRPGTSPEPVTAPPILPSPTPGSRAHPARAETKPSPLPVPSGASRAASPEPATPLPETPSEPPPTTQAASPTAVATAAAAPVPTAPSSPIEKPPVPQPGNTPPAYPREARSQGLENNVTLKLIVSEEGRVQEVVALGGDEPFVSAAIDAVKKWRYSPGLRDGRPVASELIVRVPFKLRKR